MPDDLVKPTTGYKIRVVAVLTSLLIFLAFYVAMVGLSGYFFWWSLTAPLDDWLFRFFAVLTSGMLFLFFLKGLFKRQREDRDGLIEVTASQQPRLFAFIDRLCEETGAPKPLKVYLSPEVNAAVFYDSSLLSLIWPVRKNLLIGLGLVNSLNLSEFKAVLAHEFGHFSQKTMKLGTYVYVLNQVITDMTYGRDRWDQALAMWRRIDLRLSFMAWILTGVIWVIRLFMKGAFRVINIFNAALSRQMEFNADLVAVRAAGSDQIVNALGRLEFADQCLNQTFRDLAHAADQNYYSEDIFYHQTRSAGLLRELAKDDTMGVLPEGRGPEHRLFAEENDSRPSMWASHPPNFEREVNAKRRYVDGPTDERSPWELFDEPDELKRKLTTKLYGNLLGEARLRTVDFQPPRVVQEFIEAEHRDAVFDARYRDVYDRRIPSVPEVDSVAAQWEGTGKTKASLLGELEELYDDELAEKVEKYHQLGDELALLAAAARGELGKKFEFQKETYRAEDAADLMALRDDEFQSFLSWFADFDEKVFCLHLEAARRLDAEEPFVDRYRCHQDLMQLKQRIDAVEAGCTNLLGLLGSGKRLQPEEVEGIRQEFSFLASDLEALVRDAQEVELPPLNNISAGTTAGQLLSSEPSGGEPEFTGELSGEWIEAFLNRVARIRSKMGRLIDKSTSGILDAQQELVETLGARRASGDNESAQSRNRGAQSDSIPDEKAHL